MKKAIILCSGGLDSTVCAHYVMKKLGYKEIKMLFFDYGQRSFKAEKKAMIRCAKDVEAEYHLISLNGLNKLIFSGITHNVKHEKLTRKNLRNTKEESSKFYVPFRNTIFASYAIAYAETLGRKDKVTIFFGFKSEGSESYSDTTKEYVKELNNLLKKMKILNVNVSAPLIDMDKEDIVTLGVDLHVPIEKTFSCYINSKTHCGKCLACVLRQEGFYWANIRDRTRYLSKK